MPATRNPAETYVSSQLDALRAVAVAGVMFTHFVPESVPLVGVPGFVGVRLFFVMSGFLIYKFYWRLGPGLDAFARSTVPYTREVFCASFRSIYAACALMCLSSKSHPSIRGVALHLYSEHQVRSRWPLSVVAHLWSLAVEGVERHQA